jgi:choline-sulfatase
MTNKINRREFIKGAVVGAAGAHLLGLSSISAAAAARSKKPNILFIMSDQHTGTAAGCYGNEQVRTPNLDALADQGVRFEYPIVQSPLCIPSRACLLTGKYPQCHGLLNQKNRLRKDEVFLADLLHSAGYWVGSVGKMHHIPPQEKRGFVDMCDIPMWMQGKAGMAREHDRNVRGTPNAPICGISGLDTEDHPSSQLTNKAIKVLRERAADQERPFLLWVSYVPPHHPCLPSPEYAAMYDPPSIKLPTNFGKPSYYPLWHINMMRQYFGLHFDADTEAIKTFIARYYGEISLIDFNLGRIMKELDSLGLSENTLVVYTADHGDFAGGHGAIMKGDVYDELTRVPLIMRFPREKHRGNTIPQPVEQIDLMPTFLELAGVDIPEDEVHGTSLLPLIRGDTDQHKQYIFSMLKSQGMQYGRFALRSKHWLYVEDGAMDRELLFNLDNDPGQITNVALLPDNREVISEHRARLRTYFEGKYKPASPESLPIQMRSSLG